MNLIFSLVPNPGNKTCRWMITSARTGEQIGYIEYRPTWRKYIWGTLNNAVFDVTCTQEVINFLTVNKDARQ